MIGIYKITNPKNKIYIGSSNDIANRWCKYKNLKCKSQIKLYNSLKKYGVENHTFEVVEVISLDDISTLLKREYYYSILYNVLDKNSGLNCRIPKVDGGYTFMSEETKKKISDKNKLKQKGKKHGHYESILKSLSVSQVIEIKNMLVNNILTQKEIGKLFGVARKVISNICIGKSYETIGADIDLTKRKKKYIKLKIDNYDEIKKLYKDGMKQTEIAKLYCVDASHISRICSNDRYIKTLTRKDGVS